MADVDDKEVWYSEGCATFGYSELQENKTAEYGAGTIGGYQSRWPCWTACQRLCRFPPHDVHVPACDWFLL
mgnify:FL=1